MDESGKGDYFGPLVVAACYVGPEHLAELEGVRDSKKLTDAISLKLARTIARVCPHKVLTILPAKYNELYAQIGNLNKLLAWGHARAIEDVLEIAPCEYVVSDQFADPAELKRRLFAKGRQVRLESRVRAEADVAVAAASVLARAEFLRRLQRLEQEAEIELPKGASAGVVAAAKRYVARHGPDALGRVAKLHFKTTRQVLDQER